MWNLINRSSIIEMESNWLFFKKYADVIGTDMNYCNLVNFKQNGKVKGKIIFRISYVCTYFVVSS